MAEHLGDPQAVLVVDETGFLKKGSKSAGVQRQYSGTAGRIENCQVGVFLAYAGPSGHALIDRELYLPEGWTADRRRCRVAGIPEHVEFHTKPQLARVMLERALDAGVPCGWVTADEVYGGDSRLRRWLEERDVPHVLAVKRSQALWSLGLRQERAAKLARQLPARAWRQLSAGDGAKGPRVYAWARVAIRPLREPGRGHWLLVRRRLTDGELAYSVCYGPARTTLAELVRVAGARWMVESGFQLARASAGWTTTRSVATRRGIGTSRWRWRPLPFWRSCGPGRCWWTRGAAECAEVAELLVPLSVPEIRRLLAVLAWRLAPDPNRVLAWSLWRRRHQARARRCHWRQRQRLRKVRL